MKHTPGPWNSITQSNEVILIKSGHVEVARVNPHFDESQTNARLIAVAPDMLKALECLVDPVSGEFWDEYKKYILSSDKKLIMKTIKKAKGL